MEEASKLKLLVSKLSSENSKLSQSVASLKQKKKLAKTEIELLKGNIAIHLYHAAKVDHYKQEIKQLKALKVETNVQ